MYRIDIKYIYTKPLDILHLIATGIMQFYLLDNWTCINLNWKNIQSAKIIVFIFF